MIKKFLGAVLLLIILAAILLYTPDGSFESLKEKYADEKSQFLDLHGVPVHYKVEGSGIPVLLLHGTGSSLHTWDDWAESLSDSFQIVRLDLPAYGLTGPRPDRDYALSTYIQFLDEFTEAIGIDSFHIAGNSFGGELAFIYAGHHPEKVGKIILVDAAGLPSGEEPPMVFKLASNPITALILKKVTPKSFIKKNMLEVYEDDELVTDEIVTRYHDMATREGNREAFVDRVNTPSVDYSHLLSKLEEPTLIMWGEKDEWAPFENAAIMDKMIPNSRIVSYAEVGHLPMEEYPVQSAKDAKEFLLNDL